VLAQARAQEAQAEQLLHNNVGRLVRLTLDAQELMRQGQYARVQDTAGEMSALRQTIQLVEGGLDLFELGMRTAHSDAADEDSGSEEEEGTVYVNTRPGGARRGATNPSSKPAAIDFLGRAAAARAARGTRVSEQEETTGAGRSKKPSLLTGKAYGRSVRKPGTSTPASRKAQRGRGRELDTRMGRAMEEGDANNEGDGRDSEGLGEDADERDADDVDRRQSGDEADEEEDEVYHEGGGEEEADGSDSDSLGDRSDVSERRTKGMSKPRARRPASPRR